jgi:hypothetical protein
VPRFAFGGDAQDDEEPTGVVAVVVKFNGNMGQ